MDEIDVRILGLLHENARLPIAEMSRQISLSQPAVTERLRKLEDRGIVAGYRAQLSPSKLGKHSTAFILFRTNRCTDFTAFCGTSSEIIDLYRISGENNFLLKVVTESTESLTVFLDSCNAYGFSTVLIVLSTEFEDRNLAAQSNNVNG
ncbi:Lrp/AsnC family transcriptional regulator [Cohnella sp. AR92]|uniref:Lrp/AsnC family transcriptional regulator n=1 Tax=Cohnella sp. AR92 TaxID=648716 RepID=UPI000F8E3B34|nr:Lrp/AsnC family transcriptional regulator [Cohnella sp. AR92]RUS43894.1 Lrp/AsnC family transcriptional regulator [Cohnella sp. AR92]